MSYIQEALDAAELYKPKTSPPKKQGWYFARHPGEREWGVVLLYRDSMSKKMEVRCVGSLPGRIDPAQIEYGERLAPPNTPAYRPRIQPPQGDEG